MVKIFINYRRGDSIATAGRLHDRLAKSFGRDNIFMDVDHIPAGVDFVGHLEKQIAACDVLLALIGHGWLNATDKAGQRRIDDPNDFVAIEVASALARDIPLIPVLIDGASMPPEKALPERLRGLSRRNAIDVRNTQFGSDADRLAEKIRAVTGARASSPLLWSALLGFAAVIAAGLWYAQPERSVTAPTPNAGTTAIAPQKDFALPTGSYSKKVIKVCMGNGGGENCLSGADAKYDCDSYKAMGGGSPKTYKVLADRFCFRIDNDARKIDPHDIVVIQNNGGGQCGWTAFQVTCNP